MLSLNNATMDKELQKNICHTLSSTDDPIFYYAELKTHSMALWLNEKYKGNSKKHIARNTLEKILAPYDTNNRFELFQTDTTIDINQTGVSKAAAVDFYINAGFKLEQIARVGDSTYSGGNDLPMVQYNGVGDNGGFSVQHYDELNSFPIISLPKAINKAGINATHWLLKNIRFNENQAYIFN
jgi:hydroxymethylpyrimidine pyrophosphatase-like HAD family hydrolase